MQLDDLERITKLTKFIYPELEVMHACKQLV